MGETKIGRVRMGFKGTWDNATPYNSLDAVYYLGETYVATQDVSAGINPTNATYWQKVAKKGDDAPQGPEDQVAMVTGVQQAMNLGGILLREMDVLRRRVLAQGVVLIKNKYVISGMQLSKSGVRALHLSQTGTVASGLSKAQLDGLIVALADDDYHVSVPTNATADPVQYYAYLVKDGAEYRVQIGLAVPDAALALYRIDIPAGDTASNLDAATLVDLRVIHPENAWTSVIKPFASVAFPNGLPSADYGVQVEIEDATNIAAVGHVSIYDKANNGFKVRQSGSADNVRLRWTVLNPNYQ
jgi:hypothetical protein